MRNNINVIGVDEVGRGSLAGPVVAAAVILKSGIKSIKIKDSKKISFKKRLKIADYIKKNSKFSIGTASVKEIQKLNILNASLLSMKRAIKKLKVKNKKILIDGKFAPKGLTNYRTIIKGDEKIKSISAASIIAKVYRDLLMIKISKKFKNYHLDKNFGYGTKLHLKCLKKYGVTPIHRKSFKPIHNMLLKGKM